MKKIISVCLIFVFIMSCIFLRKTSVAQFFLFQIKSKRILSWAHYKRIKKESLKTIAKEAAGNFLAAAAGGDYEKARHDWYKPVTYYKDLEAQGKIDKQIRVIVDILKTIKEYSYVDYWVFDSRKKEGVFEPYKKKSAHISIPAVPKAKIHLFADENDFPAGNFAGGIYQVVKYLVDFGDLGELELFLYFCESPADKTQTVRVIVLKGPKPVIIGLHERTKRQFNIDVYENRKIIRTQHPEPS